MPTSIRYNTARHGTVMDVAAVLPAVSHGLARTFFHSIFPLRYSGPMLIGRFTFIRRGPRV
jgi:hypothetical protein